MVHAYQSVYNNLQKIEDGYEESVRSVRKYFYVTGNVRIIFVIESNTKLLLIDDYHDLSLKKKKKIMIYQPKCRFIITNRTYCYSIN